MKFKIAITSGDINGIGYEVILKSLSNPHIFDLCIPILYGNANIAIEHQKLLKGPGSKVKFNVIIKPDQAIEGAVNVINCYADATPLNIGFSSQAANKASLASLSRACSDIKNGLVDAMVTAPIDKRSLYTEEKPFIGHTEYLSSFFGVAGEDTVMMMINEYVKIGLVTNHVPISRVSSYISSDVLIRKIQIIHQSFQECFGLNEPRIAVLALNPHRGDGGLVGDEDDKILVPTIERLCSQNKLVFGPYSSDGFWGAGQYVHFDVVVAMYHDQGLIPFKLLDMGGVNFTAGLPVIRTSPDHGVAYDIAGKDRANPQSFTNAIYSAIDLIEARHRYVQVTASALKNDSINQNFKNDDDK